MVKKISEAEFIPAVGLGVDQNLIFDQTSVTLSGPKNWWTAPSFQPVRFVGLVIIQRRVLLDQQLGEILRDILQFSARVLGYL